VLDALGLGPALTSVMESPGLRVTDARGHTLLTPPAGSRIGIITRSRLQEVLLDALLAEPRVRCRFGTTLERADRDGTVVLSDTNGAHTERFDLVVGADGVHSKVRASGNFGARMRRTGIHYLRALVPVTVNEGTEAWTPVGLFGAVPVDGGAYVYASCASATLAKAIVQRNLPGLVDAWRSAYALAGELLGSVTRFEQLLIHEVVRVDCDRWHDERIVLVGDAAHAMAPNLGQGANSALVDAAVLFDALREAPDLATGLADYAARRQHKVRHVADTAERLARLADLAHPLLRLLRDRVLMPVVNRLPSDQQLRAVMQESPETLARMCRI
jgi:2-polyprenyl-6-methoxyphenol hydroxylase-like FAD-dependent oxidoreductase